MPAIRIPSHPAGAISSLYLTKPPPASPPAGAGGIAIPDPVTLRRVLAAGSNINVALATQTPVSYDGRLITPVGSADRPPAPKTLSDNSTPGGSQS
jgi:hypothetical protein